MASVTPAYTLVGRQRFDYNADEDSFTYQGEVRYEKCGVTVTAPYSIIKSGADAVTFTFSEAINAVITYDDADCV